MPRKPARPSRGSHPRSSTRQVSDSKRTTAGLNELRASIDKLDRDLVTLLNRRASVAIQIGQIKDKQGLEVWSPAREDEVLERALATSDGPLPEETIRLIFRELMSGSRSLQRPLRIACLGPKYSYSYLAAVSKFGNAVEHVPVGSISAVFEEVSRRHVQFGLVPLENSIDGRVTDTLEMFTTLPLRIRAEVKMRIHHCLLSKGQWGQIRRVYSKAQALSQCRHWLGKNLPQAQAIEVVSTAAAAELAQRDETGAAIASRPAADAYGLNVLAENIEDQTENVTRFAVIAEQSEGRTGRDKTTLMLRLPHQVGSLMRAIEPFAKNGVTMTWIESFPAHHSTTDGKPQYIFFMDVEGHANDPPVKRALDLLRKRSDRIEILGSYPRAQTIEG